MANLFFQELITDPEKALNKVVRRAVHKELLSFKLSFNSPVATVQAEYLSRKQAALFLQVSMTQVYYLQKRGILKSYRIGKKVFFNKSDLLNVYSSK